MAKNSAEPALSSSHSVAPVTLSPDGQSDTSTLCWGGRPSFMLAILAFAILFALLGATVSILAILWWQSSSGGAGYALAIVGVAVGGVVLAIICCVAAYQLLIRPLSYIVDAMNRVADLNFDQLGDDDDDDGDGRVPRAHHPSMMAFKETRQLAISLARMGASVRYFSQYVPKEVVRDLMGAADVQRGMQIKDIVVMFTDIANFTTICETVPTDDLMLLLNAYFADMIRIILAHDISLDKILGDGLVTFANAPLDHPYPVFSTCCCALHMQAVIQGTRLREMYEAFGFELEVRIGIHIGVASVGNIGSAERLSYTALGDTVNTASRLEGMNKHYKTRIMVSGAIAWAKESSVFVFRHLGAVILKGRSEGLSVYELLGVDAQQSVPEWLQRLHEDGKRGTAARGGDHERIDYGLAVSVSEEALSRFGGGDDGAGGENSVSRRSGHRRQSLSGTSTVLSGNNEKRSGQQQRPGAQREERTRISHRKTKVAELSPTGEYNSVGKRHLFTEQIVSLVLYLNSVVDAGDRGAFADAAAALRNVLREDENRCRGNSGRGCLLEKAGINEESIRDQITLFDAAAQNPFTDDCDPPLLFTATEK